MMRGRHRRIAIEVAVLFAAFGAGVGWLAAKATGRPWPIPATIGAAAGASLIGVLVRNAERRTIEQYRAAGQFDDQTLTIRPEGFDHAIRDGRTITYPWKAVLKVGKTPKDFLIILNENQFVSVPLRAFRSESYADLFLAVAGSWHLKATGQEGSTRANRGTGRSPPDRETAGNRSKPASTTRP